MGVAPPLYAGHVRAHQVFAESCAGGLGNTLFHERAAEIICARLQARERGFETQLHPGDLQVLDGPVKQQARQRVYPQVFVALRTRPRSTMTVEPRLLMDESERHELGKSTGAFLDRAQ